jgi:trigger factor
MQSQNMSADPVRVRESIEELAATYESPEEVINWYYGNQEQLSAIESSVVEDQVFDYILGEAKVADKTVSYQEVIKPESKQPAEGA